MKIKLNSYAQCLFCSLLSSLMIVSVSKAQEKNKVIFENYTNAQADFLHLLKKDGGISSYTPMSVLKRNAERLKENAIVAVKLPKPRKSKVQLPDVIRERKESVLMMCQYMSGTTQSEKVEIFATGIVLSEDGICATNYHVLWRLIDQSFKLNPVDSILFVATASGKLYPIQAILSYNKTADMAIFKIDTGSDKLMPFPMGKDVPVGTTVHTLTHPEGYLYSYSKGVVSRNIATDSNDPFTNRTEITADYAKGSSGGPIFDDYGNLVSMVSTTRSIYYTDRPQINFQMAVKQTIPVSSLLSLIKVNSVDSL